MSFRESDRDEEVSEEQKIFEERLLEALKKHLSIDLSDSSSSDSYGHRSTTVNAEIYFKGVPICNGNLYL